VCPPRLAPGLAALALLACTDPGPADDSASVDLTEVTGGYQFFVDGVSTSNLCKEEVHFATDWLRGTLSVAGEVADAVTFTFSDGMAFTGGVDDSWSYWFGGGATWQEATLDVSHHGTFGTEDDRRTVGGSFEVVVDDDEFVTNNCILEVRISGVRISE
jgi:hypothetical protein